MSQATPGASSTGDMIDQVMPHGAVFNCDFRKLATADITVLHII